MKKFFNCVTNNTQTPQKQKKVKYFTMDFKMHSASVSHIQANYRGYNESL